MRITALVENKDHYEKRLSGEHGLSIYIEYKGKKVLLDAGTTPLFARNAHALGISLEAVDVAVLSHAHYDHGGGFEEFFEKNKKAALYMQKSCQENCWRLAGTGKEHLKYIGLPCGMLKKYGERIRYVSGDCELFSGAWLISHHFPKLWEKGKTAGMLRLTDGVYVYDDFSHEQSLVFETKQGLVIFNSCCHSGPDIVVEEVLARPCFNGQKVYALFGGFHLKDISQNDAGRQIIENLGQRLLALGVWRFYTGHCTGDGAFFILSSILGERLAYFKTGDICLLES